MIIITGKEGGMVRAGKKGQGGKYLAWGDTHATPVAVNDRRRGARYDDSRQLMLRLWCPARDQRLETLETETTRSRDEV